MRLLRSPSPCSVAPQAKAAPHPVVHRNSVRPTRGDRPPRLPANLPERLRIPRASEPVPIGIKPHAIGFRPAAGEEILLRQIGRRIFRTVPVITLTSRDPQPLVKRRTDSIRRRQSEIDNIWPCRTRTGRQGSRLHHLILQFQRFTTRRIVLNTALRAHGAKVRLFRNPCRIHNGRRRIGRARFKRHTPRTQGGSRCRSQSLCFDFFSRCNSFCGADRGRRRGRRERLCGNSQRRRQGGRAQLRVRCGLLLVEGRIVPETHTRCAIRHIRSTGSHRQQSRPTKNKSHIRNLLEEFPAAYHHFAGFATKPAAFSNA